MSAPHLTVQQWAALLYVLDSGTSPQKVLDSPLGSFIGIDTWQGEIPTHVRTIATEYLRRPTPEFQRWQHRLAHWPPVDPTILVTGFEPFRGLSRNPSWEVLAHLSDVHKLLLPTEFQRARRLLIDAVTDLEPDLVLSFGLSGRDPKICIETTGWNFADGIDNSNHSFHSRLVDDPNAPVCHDTTVDAAALVAHVNAGSGTPARISTDAGLFVCNSVMFTLGELNRTGAQFFHWGFVHIPAREDDPQFGPKYYKARFAALQESVSRIVAGALEQIRGELMGNSN